MTEESRSPQQFEWKKVVAPKTWRPRFNGEELIGFYGGTTERRGGFGAYSVVLVHTPNRGSFMVSGAQVIQLVHASTIEPGDSIRIVYMGVKDLGESEEDGRRKKMKLFEVYETAGTVFSPGDLERLREELTKR